MFEIVGFIASGGIANNKFVQDLISVMHEQLMHCGPDDAGTWLDRAGGLAFGFRRLSTVDLSAAGHQPMLSANGRYAIMLNGEIYNAADIRAEIEASGGTRVWRSHCDAEVLVEAVCAWGVEEAVRRSNGMFATAVWDRHDRALWLARDRNGKKPLYFGWAGKIFVFGSDLKTLWPQPELRHQVSLEAMDGFLKLGYALGPHTLLTGMSSFTLMSNLPAGHLLYLDQVGVARRYNPVCCTNWRLHDLGSDSELMRTNLLPEKLPVNAAAMRGGSGRM